MRIVPMTLLHAEQVGANLREADLREIHTLHPDACPKEILSRALGMSSYAFAAQSSSGIVCVGGTAPRGDGSGSVWLLGTPLMENHRISLGRMSPACISMMHKRYRVIHNMVDSRNALHLNWLRWCGFQTLNTEIVNGVPFIHHYHIKD